MAKEATNLELVPEEGMDSEVEISTGWSTKKKVVVGTAVTVGVVGTGVVVHKLMTAPGRPSSYRGKWGTQETKDRVQAIRNIHDVENANSAADQAADRLKAAVRAGDEKAIREALEWFKHEQDAQAGNLHRYTEFGDRQQRLFNDAFETASKYCPELLEQPAKSREALDQRFTQEQAANVEQALNEALAANASLASDIAAMKTVMSELVARLNAEEPEPPIQAVS